MDPTAPPTDTLPPGSRLLNYRIARLLGRGGFGVIYLAVDVNLGHRVAIKEYLPAEIAGRSQNSRVQPSHNDHSQLYQWGLERFVKEARNLVRFRHPNIVRVSALFQENNTAYMVMDFEEGLSLRQYLQSDQHRTEAELKRLIKPIAQGLSEVHRQGFIHRDIKPSNLLVRKDGSPVLLDFGSARLASRHATHGLTALVSSGYAPLEQYNPESEEQQGPWSDIYALGGVLYFGVTLRDPADSTQRSLAIVNGQNDPLESASALGQGRYSEAFLRAIDWALSVRIADRPQMLGDWIPALFADTVPPDASITTQQLLDQQTRLASVSKVAAPVSNLLANEEDWTDSMDTADRRDTKPGGASIVTDRAAEPVRRSYAGWVIGLVALIALGAAGTWAYQQLNSKLTTQQASVEAQRRAADEALARAESAREEALAAISAQRERDAEQIRLGAERLVAEREAERAAAQAQQEAQQAAEEAAQLAAEQAAEQAAQNAAQQTAQEEAQAAERAREAEAAKAAEQQRAEQRRAEQARAEQRRVEQAVKAAERERLLEQQRAQQLAATQQALATARQLSLQNDQLDQALDALQLNNLSLARSRLSSAMAVDVENARIAAVTDALNAAEQNAREPISDEEFERIVGQFHQLKEAIERGNLTAIQRLADGDSELALFTRLIERFDQIDVSISGIRARDADKSIVGTLRIDQMIRDNGNRAIPSSSYRERQILSRRVAGDWTLIQW